MSSARSPRRPFAAGYGRAKGGGQRARCPANFVEIKNADSAKAPKVPHLSLCRDCGDRPRPRTSARATITCNYDGGREAPQRDRRARLHRLEHDAVVPRARRRRPP